MDTAIIVVWSVALAAALLLTLWILKLVFLIVRTEREILQLAGTTLAAARGIEANTALIAKLQTTENVAGRILNAAVAIEAGTSSLKDKLRALRQALG